MFDSSLVTSSGLVVDLQTDALRSALTAPVDGITNRFVRGRRVLLAAVSVGGASDVRVKRCEHHWSQNSDRVAQANTTQNVPYVLSDRR